MNRSNVILKSTCYFLLLVICWQFSCAAFCAVGTNNCCGGEKQGLHAKTCCSNKSRPNDKGNCQGKHIAFFQTLGQSSVEADLKSPDRAGNFVLFIHNYTFNELVPSDFRCVPFAHFKPPPLQADVRTFISSFQI